MKEVYPITIIRKSIAVLVIKIYVLQTVAVFAYVLVRLSNAWLFSAFFIDSGPLDANFWLGIFAFIVIMTAQAAILITVVLEWFNESYEVRHDLIIHTRGVFKRKEDIYSLKTVEAGSIMQPLFGKLFNYGTVKIYSPVLKREYWLSEIPNPQKVRDSIVDLLGVTQGGKRKIIPKETASTGLPQ